MYIPVEKWFQAQEVRKSRRQFNGKPLDPTTLNLLEEFVQQLNNQLTGVRVVIVNKDPDKVFKGAIGSYGKIKGAPSYVAFIGDLRDANVQEKLGYLGECFILEATSLQLGTCWVGGFFRPEAVAKDINLLPGEQVICVTPLGYTEQAYNRQEKILVNIASSRNRKELSKLCTGLPESEWPAWVRSALESARLAPSAVNRQPWRFVTNARSITVKIDSPLNLAHISKRLDCGIAMLHLELGALKNGVKGKWKYLDNPDVAIFELIND